MLKINFVSAFTGLLSAKNIDADMIAKVLEMIVEFLTMEPLLRNCCRTNFEISLIPLTEKAFSVDILFRHHLPSLIRFQVTKNMCAHCAKHSADQLDRTGMAFFWRH